ncbi:MAG: hypothetical protein ABSB95_13590 [Dissulfurispiraceae bacterium]
MMRKISFVIVLMFVLSITAACSGNSQLDGRWKTAGATAKVGDWWIFTGPEVGIYGADPKGEAGTLFFKARWEKDPNTGKINIFQVGPGGAKVIRFSCVLTTPDQLDSAGLRYKRVSK